MILQELDIFTHILLNFSKMDEPEPENDEDIDGALLSDVDGDGTEDLDGVPLDGATLLKGAMKHGVTSQATSNYDDIDGVPSN